MHETRIIFASDFHKGFHYNIFRVGRSNDNWISRSIIISTTYRVKLSATWQPFCVGLTVTRSLDFPGDVKEKSVINGHFE